MGGTLLHQISATVFATGVLLLLCTLIERVNSRGPFSWREDWSQTIADQDPDVVVMMLGGWDGKFVRENGALLATPLFLVLVLVETTDLIFAVDSIPAIFAVTSDPFIVYTSNVFAILGLRALFFVLAGMMDKFVYLKPGVALILIFVGIKMTASYWVHVPILVSLAVIVLTLGAAVGLSLRRTAREARTPA